jgi:hypothetical protein
MNKKIVLLSTALMAAMMLSLALTPALANPTFARVPTWIKPHDINGPGYGIYLVAGGSYKGSVWAHYGESNAHPGQYEVGIEGTYPVSWTWYEWGQVTVEHFNGPILVAQGVFTLLDMIPPTSTPLKGLPFTYIANLKTGGWVLFGPGFFFMGTLKIINYS